MDRIDGDSTSNKRIRTLASVASSSRRKSKLDSSRIHSSNYFHSGRVQQFLESRLRHAVSTTWIPENPSMRDPFILDLVALSREKVLGIGGINRQIVLYTPNSADQVFAPHDDHLWLNRSESEPFRIIAYGNKGLDVFDEGSNSFSPLLDGAISSADINETGNVILYSLAFPGNGNALLKVCAIDVRQQQPLSITESLSLTVNYASRHFVNMFANDQQRFLLCDSNGQVSAYDMRKVNRPYKEMTIVGAPQAPRWVKESQSIAPGFSRHSSVITNVATLFDVDRFMTCSEDGQCKIWSIGEETCQTTISGVDFEIPFLVSRSFPTDSAFVELQHAQSIAEVSLCTGNVVHTFPKQRVRETCMAFVGSDGATEGFVTGDTMGRISLWWPSDS